MGCDIHSIVQIKRNNKWEYVPELPEELDERNYHLFAILADVRNSFNLNHFEPKGLPEDLGVKKYRWKSEKESHKKSYEERTITKVRMPDGSLKDKYDDMFKVEITKEEFSDNNSKWSRSSDGTGHYYAWKPELFGEVVEVPYKEVFKTFEEYLNEYYDDEYDADLNDYGHWDVNFDCDSYHSSSYLTLKELEDFDSTNVNYTKVKVLSDFFTKFFELGGKLPDGMELESNYEPSDFHSIIQEAFCPMTIVRWKDDNKEENDDSFNNMLKRLKEIAKQYDVSNENLRIVFAFDN